MKKLLVLSFLLATGLTQAQVVVDNSSQTISDLIQNVLVGEGVEVFNVEINGQPGNQLHLQAGEFSDANGDIGLNEGMILGSGNVILAEQVNTALSGGASLPGVATQYSFPPLEALTSFPVLDQVVVEFDFIPQGDTLTFSYVFASEEYPEYVCGNINDVFGFFLTGNNPGGGVYVNENLALIPDPLDPNNYTNTPVTINTLGPGVEGVFGDPATCADVDPNWEAYAIFYQSNNEAPYASYEYDGRSVGLTARAVVNCGEVYHITMALGDGSDSAFDSAVFLKAGSFAAEPSGLTLESFFAGGLVEISSNCDSATAIIRRNCAADTVFYQLNYLVNDSTAEYGVDYEPLPLTAQLLPGEDELNVPIITIADGIEEDIEYICIEVFESNNFDGPYISFATACIPIVDSYTFPVSVDEERMVCPEDLLESLATPQFPGEAPYDYVWTFQGGDTLSTENFYEPPTPNQGDTVYYDVEVIDFCGAIGQAEALVANAVPDDPTALITASDQYCPGIGYPLNGGSTGGTFPLVFSWTDELGGSYPSEQFITVDPQSDYGTLESLTYTLLVEDVCNPTRSAEVQYVLDYPEPLELNISMNNQLCADQVLDLFTNTSGGYTPYTFTWTSAPQLLPAPGFPSATGFVTNDTDGEGEASGFYTDGMIGADNAFILTLQMDDTCSQVSPLFLPGFDTDTVEVLDCIYPNVISPNGDGNNDALVINELINREGTMYIYNRWGNLLSQSSSHEWIATDEEDGTYYYVVQFNDDEENKERKGYFTIVR